MRSFFKLCMMVGVGLVLTVDVKRVFGSEQYDFNKGTKFNALVHRNLTFSVNNLKSTSVKVDGKGFGQRRPFPSRSSILDFSFKFDHPSEDNPNDIMGIYRENATGIENKIVQFAETTNVIILPKTIFLFESFLNLKRTEGSNREKALYKDMTVDQFAERLLKNRFLVFVGYGGNNLKLDRILLRNNKSEYMGKDFHLIATDQECGLSLNEYISYEEMILSALLGVSSQTYFADSAGRNSIGKFGIKEEYAESGIIGGLVGTRFEQILEMESKYIIVHKRQNTAENGYGLKACSKGMLKILSEFFDGIKFPTYEEAEKMFQEGNTRFIKFDYKSKSADGKNDITEIMYFDTFVNEKRLEITFEMLLSTANYWAEKENKDGFARVPGFGLGVWTITDAMKSKQTKLFLEAFQAYVSKYIHLFPRVKTINFMWFGSCDGWKIYDEAKSSTNGGFVILDTVLKIGERELKIKFSKDDLASPIPNPEKNLLIGFSPVDAGALFANEAWSGILGQSTEPGNYVGSNAMTLHNPYINDHLLKNAKKTVQNSQRKANKIVENKGLLDLVLAKAGVQHLKSENEELTKQVDQKSKKVEDLDRALSMVRQGFDNKIRETSEELQKVKQENNDAVQAVQRFQSAINLLAKERCAQDAELEKLKRKNHTLARMTAKQEEDNKKSKNLLEERAEACRQVLEKNGTLEKQLKDLEEYKESYLFSLYQNKGKFAAIIALLATGFGGMYWLIQSGNFDIILSKIKPA